MKGAPLERARSKESGVVEQNNSQRTAIVFARRKYSIANG